jgi:lipopolysaccharide/colanic/teichoic acid biosynthesis glycosyltransferase
MSAANRWWRSKYVLEWLLGALGFLVILPLLALLALLVKVSSPGPAIFRQERVGRNGRAFVLLKFRTMRTEVRGQRSEVSGQCSERDATFEAGCTARVTSVGRILRKWKLDELPQLWNVLKGDMSLVGPRPEIRKWVEAYPERWARVLTVRPGITDPASIVYRNEEEILARSPDPERAYREVILPRKLDLYEEYVRTRSFWGDVGILLRTVWAVVGK